MNDREFNNRLCRMQAVERDLPHKCRTAKLLAASAVVGFAASPWWIEGLALGVMFALSAAVLAISASGDADDVDSERRLLEQAAMECDA